ncbi:MAG: hypothetical protein FWC39_06785 [Bacteroidetes bacterium]|nr:hypothetical protein [Bacteroidota bacterium]
MKKHLLPLTAFLIAALAMSSCVKDHFEMKNKFSGDISWNPELAIPLAKAKLTLRNMLKERDDTLMYVSENKLGYGTNAGDSVLLLRFGIDTSQSVSLLSLPAMADYDTTILLKPVTIETANFKLPLAQKINILLNDNFSAADVATYNGYASSPPPIVNVSAISAIPPFHEYTLTDPSGTLSETFEYVCIKNGFIKLTCANAFTVPIQCDVELVADSAGVRKPIGTFPLSTQGWINPINSTNWVEIDPENPPANMAGTRSIEIPVSDIYIGQKIYYTYKNLKFAEQANTVLNLEILNKSSLFSVVEFRDLEVSKGKAVVTNQVISTDTTVYITVSSDKIDQKLIEVRVENGEVNYDIESAVDIATHIIFTFPTVTKNGQTAKFEERIDKITNTAQGNMSLNGYTIDLTEPSPATPLQKYNSLPMRISYRVEASGMTEFGGDQEIHISMGNRDSIRFNFLRGNIGRGEEEIMTDIMDFDMGEVLNVFSGDVRFADPQLKLRFTNPIAVDAEIELDMSASNNKGEMVQIFGEGIRKFPIQAPDCNGVLNNRQETTTIPLDKNTSNIVEFLRIMPNFIEYSGKLLYNQKDLSGTSENCMSNTANVGLAIDVDVPMNVEFSNVILATDIDIENSIGDAASLDTLIILLKAKNQFPIDARLVITMLDTTKPEGKQVLGVLPEKPDDKPLFLLKAAPADANGKVNRNEVKEFTTEIGIGRNLFDAFTNANRIRIEAILDTYGEKGKSIILYSFYSIDVQIAANGKILIKDRL